MKLHWYKKQGWIYLPIHITGYLVTIMAVIFLIPVYAAIFRNGHFGWDNLNQMFVYTTCTAFWWKWIAEKQVFKN